MKKLTKKAIKEAAIYMAQIDWKTSCRDTLDFVPLKAQNLIEAMNEASERFDENVYMLSILEKTGEMVDDNGLKYEEILRSRTVGRWLTVKQDGLARGYIYGRYFYDILDEHCELIELSERL